MKYVTIPLVHFIAIVKLVIRIRGSFDRPFSKYNHPWTPHKPAESSTASGLVKLSELFCEDKNECLGTIFYSSYNAIV